MCDPLAGNRQPMSRPMRPAGGGGIGGGAVAAQLEELSAQLLESKVSVLMCTSAFQFF